MKTESTYRVPAEVGQYLLHATLVAESCLDLARALQCAITNMSIDMASTFSHSPPCRDGGGDRPNRKTWESGLADYVMTASMHASESSSYIDGKGHTLHNLLKVISEEGAAMMALHTRLIEMADSGDI